MIVVHVRCTRLSVVTVAKKPRFHSSLRKAVQSIVRSVIRSIEQNVGTKRLYIYQGPP